jgi:Rha family phage regulatory protein
MAQLTLGTSAAITPALSAVNGTPTALSTDVAVHFGKQHNDVLKAIDKLAQELPADRLGNFAQTVVERPNPAGGAPIQSRAYRLTRDGFTLLAMGFTGKKALAFKLAYLDAFNRMEAELAGRPLPAPPVLAQHTDADLLDKLGLAASIGQLVQGEVFTELLKKSPINRHGLPVEAYVLVNQHAARICAQTFHGVSAWLARDLHSRVRLDVPHGLHGRVDEQLRRLDHQSWLTQERNVSISSLLTFLEVAKDVATKGEAALHEQLEAMRQAQECREYAVGSGKGEGSAL